MSSPDRLDRLLRTELRRADDFPVESRYHAVLARSAQRTRRRRTGLVATAAILVVTGIGGVLQWQSSPTPPAVDQPHASLSGSWTRTVTEGTVGDGAWTLSFEEAPLLAIEGPPDRPATSVTDGASYAVRGDQVRVNIFVNGACDAAQVGAYRWTVDAGLLYLDVVEDDCEVRQELLIGTWVRGS
ncbi:MAG TPA: hypothetical protein VGJ41_03530 [Nocardioides sp.]